ncbi:DUF6484 domain-containing protein [Zoogloea ramigera]|uniref:DUF6484 domain-containing protein n=1 Tax=Zoogloea ramigera TaxID=350 RepID=UPI0011431537|nr:DUF6484 domain-containing protein [Zoogloea ramigera]
MKTEHRSVVSSQVSSPLQDLLRRPATALPARADGIAIGQLEAVDPDGLARVGISAFGLSGVVARSLVALPPERIGEAVALGFEGADPQRPIVLGFMLNAVTRSNPDPVSCAIRNEDGRLVIEADNGVELRCGEACISIDADGHVQIRGAYVTSHASASQRIRGGSVQIN